MYQIGWKEHSQISFLFLFSYVLYWLRDSSWNHTTRIQLDVFKAAKRVSRDLANTHLYADMTSKETIKAAKVRKEEICASLPEKTGTMMHANGPWRKPSIGSFSWTRQIESIRSSSKVQLNEACGIHYYTQRARYLWPGYLRGVEYTFQAVLQWTFEKVHKVWWWRAWAAAAAENIACSALGILTSISTTLKRRGFPRVYGMIMSRDDFIVKLHVHISR
jgi:hypothetical protein